MYFDKLSDLGIKLFRRSGSEKTKCPQCSDSRKNKSDKPLSVNITSGEWNCFSSDTRIITSCGVKSIEEILNEKIKVLNGNGNWSEVEFKKYGESVLYEISLTRNGRHKKIRATANHRWFARNIKTELTTDRLLSGHRLDFVFPDYMNSFTKNYKAIIAGLIFGDGFIYNKHRKKQFSKAVLIGEKDKQLRNYFEGYPIKEYEDRITVSGFPDYFKTSMPSIKDDVDYILSWISGYFAADGDVSVNGVPCINSVKYNDLLHIRDLCTKCGIGTYGISKYNRRGIGNKYSDIFRLNFIPETINSDLFLNKSHKLRFETFDKKFSRKRWIVESVINTGIISDVYCCEEPETHSFALEDNILTGNCHNCGWKGNCRAHERKRDAKKFEKPDQNMVKSQELSDKIADWFSKRGISRETLAKFMIFGKEEWMPQTQKKESCICFPYFRDGSLVNVKFRDARKNFRMVKDAELIFFNLNSIGDKKKVIIVEGECDAMAVYEAGVGRDSSIEGVVNNETGEVLEGKKDPFSEWAVISVPNGASKGNQQLEYLDNCSDWFIGLHEIIVATDNDEAGVALKYELIRRLGVERCRIIQYPIEEVIQLESGLKRRCKDLNEVLVYLGKETVLNCITNAEFIPVDGVYYIEDIFESMLANFKKGIQLAPTTRFTELDKYFRWKKGDITLCTGYGNHGKSFFILQLMLTKSIHDGWKWAVFSPENYPANDFYDDLIEMYVGKWLDKMSEQEYIDACWFIDKHIFYVYPEDDHDINSINERFRHLILKKGIDGVLVDPFNQLDHLQKPYQREDQYLSEILKDVKRFALLNNVSYTIVAHPKTPSYAQDKSLPIVDMYDISGGAMWGNKVDQIISYYRPNFHIDKNSPEVQIHIQKLKRKRTGGQLGHCDMTLIWGRKRYAEMGTGNMPCDPFLVSLNGNNMKQNDLFMPYVDGEDAPF